MMSAEKKSSCHDDVWKSIYLENLSKVLKVIILCGVVGGFKVLGLFTYDV